MHLTPVAKGYCSGLEMQLQRFGDAIAAVWITGAIGHLLQRFSSRFYTAVLFNLM